MEMHKDWDSKCCWAYAYNCSLGLHAPPYGRNQQSPYNSIYDKPKHTYPYLCDQLRGVHQGAVAVAANYIGAKKPLIVKKMVYSGCVITLALAAILALPMFVFPDLIIDGFLPYGSSVVNHSDIAFALFFVWLFFIADGFAWILGSVLIAAGDTNSVLIINLISAWIFCIVPIHIIIIYLKASPRMPWVVIALYCVVQCLLMFLRYRKHKWKSNKVIEAATQIVEA